MRLKIALLSLLLACVSVLKAQDITKETISIEKEFIGKYKLYNINSTQFNDTYFIKLNTTNGQMKLITTGIYFDKVINDSSLIAKDEVEINGRFILKPAKNQHLILLDQIKGTAWQLVWPIKYNNEILRIILESKEIVK